MGLGTVNLAYTPVQPIERLNHTIAATATTVTGQCVLCEIWKAYG